MKKKGTLADLAMRLGGIKVQKIPDKYLDDGKLTPIIYMTLGEQLDRITNNTFVTSRRNKE